MSRVYVISDENRVWGCVATEAEIGPFLIRNEILLLCDSGDGEHTIIDYLGMDENTAERADVCANFENLAYPLQKLILEQFGYSIQEMEVWSYAEWLHSHAIP